MNDIYSFYKLIREYQIEIPIIQRDYAQGRNNPKAADVRKSLVDNMIKAVKEGESLFFDFVYGRVEENKFIPFDGQQRLTTLFLFHKYIFEKKQFDLDYSQKESCMCTDMLKKFSYATRQSSREFCEQLISNNVIPSEDLAGEIGCLSSYIKNQPWFYPDWEKDPTVMGMLTMLDEIHCKMKDETDFKTFAEKLTSDCECPITFHFVDMGEHKMSDETYVKMNARGKQLTPFENFKASLEQYLEKNEKENEKPLLSRLKGKYNEELEKYSGIDGSWLDLFWNVANKDRSEKALPDTLLMSFFNRHFMNVWRCWYETTGSKSESSSESSKENDEFNSRIQNEIPLYPSKDDFVSFEIYSYVMDKCGVDNCLKPIFNICDALCAKDNNNIERDCQAIWNRDEGKQKWILYEGDKINNNRETYPSRVVFYALMMYFKESTDTSSLDRWMRVVWNIVENSTIDSSDAYQAALSLIEKLSAKSHEIYNAMATDFKSFNLGNQYHAKDQVAEEIAKARKIVEDETVVWKKKLIDAEKYAFFKGAIRFLFRTKDGKLTDWDNFDKKWTNAQNYFNNDGVKDIPNCNYKSDALLLRSLVSKCDNIEKIKGKKIFNNTAKTWRDDLLLSGDWKSEIYDILMMDKINIFNRNPCSDINQWCSDNGLFKYIVNEAQDFWLKEVLNERCYSFWEPGRKKKRYMIPTIPSLLKLKKATLITYEKGVCDIQDSDYAKCNDYRIDFSYTLDTVYYHFRWHMDMERKTAYIYILDKYLERIPKNGGKRKGKGEAPEDHEMYYCFNVGNKMDEKKSPDILFVLTKLIAECYPKNYQRHLEKYRR